MSASPFICLNQNLYCVQADVGLKSALVAVLFTPTDFYYFPNLVHSADMLLVRLGLLLLTFHRPSHVKL